ncbi:DNA polymerase IV [candidate division KSB1 bacterium]|nr:DNA polymerase IV [candidate division KSB1 bacterium]
MNHKIIFLLDMDQFFVAVEMLHYPHLRGKAVSVGGGLSGRGVVSTASYEARRYGVRSGMSSLEALRLCPHLIFVKPDFDKYATVSKRVFKLLRTYTDRVEPVSVDEAFMDVTDICRDEDAIERLATKIKQEIRTQEGVTATIGAGANRYVAKMSSGLRKPDGFTYLPPDRVADAYRNLPVGDLYGVGPATRAALERLGIRTIGQLATFPESVLKQRFGKFGPELSARARGEGSDVVSPPDEQPDEKSVSNESTFSRDLKSEFEVLARLHDQCERVARRARAAGMTGKTVTLKLRYAGFETVMHSRKLHRYVQNETDLYPVAARLFSEVYQNERPVRLIGIGISDLLPADRIQQQDLFVESRDTSQIAGVFDDIKDKFGDDVIGYGTALVSGKGLLRAGTHRGMRSFNPFHAPNGV